MKGSFFLKMAVRNIRANRQLYLPYFIAATLTVSMFSQMVAMVNNDFVRTRSESLPVLFGFGTIVIGIFSAIFLLYTNSFLIKRRKKEIGLYGILGLEKKHVARILFLETCLVGSGSIFLGLGIGVIFGRLFFLLLNYLLRVPEMMEYTLSLAGVGIAILLFCMIFLTTYLYNVSQVTFSNPIKLLKGEKEGEKEPRSNVFLFLLGLALVGSGYWISVTISDPLAAMTQFFTAVLLVIAGTYFLFTAGSIFLLKAMKKNKKLYYRPRAFISISGMLYRMKQNAAGLSNISILSCMVIIALATTLTIYVGSEETLHTRFPAENSITVYAGEEETIEAVQTDIAYTISQIEEETAGAELEVADAVAYAYVSFLGELEGDTFRQTESLGREMPTVMVLMSLADFNRIEQENLVLAENQVYVLRNEPYPEEQLVLSEIAFEALPLTVELDVFQYGEEAAFGDALLVVMPSIERINAVLADSLKYDNGLFRASIYGDISWDTSGTEEEKLAYAAQLHDFINNGPLSAHYESRDAYRGEWYSMNGGFLFLGIFLGMLFTLGAVLITYFKQISEGYDDRGRFQIMQKVGLDKDMIRDTSRNQVVWMFMLPLLVASVHTAFAYPIIHKLLMVFGVTSHVTLISCIIGVVIVFSLLYWLIYRWTARVYYAIVN